MRCIRKPREQVQADRLKDLRSQYRLLTRAIEALEKLQAIRQGRTGQGVPPKNVQA